MQEIEHRGALDSEPAPGLRVGLEPAYDRGFEDEDLEPRPFKLPRRGRVLPVAGVLLTLVLLVVLPPLVNVNRYRRQIATSIGRSLGRPVHMDSVTLNLLPVPGFNLENFVVTEDAAFGSEPVIRANSVRATLRVSSLWHRRVEFARIALDEPSVNLVHLPDGRWNVESILLQAARMPAAPTAQRGRGDRPRFPYIEATGARVNVKMGVEKLPLSLTDARLALWLPQPDEWRLRLEGHPTRTNAPPTDAGIVRLEGTLGRAASLAALPVDLTGTWLGAPLGGVSWVLMGRDAGMRGEMTVTAKVRGTMGENSLETRLALNRVRRAEFVPVRELEADVTCHALATQLFHALREVRCTWPVSTGEDGLLLTGEMPEVATPGRADGTLRLRNVPASTLLDGLRVLSARVAPELSLTGRLNANLSAGGEGAAVAKMRTVRVDTRSATGQISIAAARFGDAAAAPFVHQDVAGQWKGNALEFGPIALDLGGATAATLTGHVDNGGYRLRLSGPVKRERLLTLAAELPQFGDGLREALGPVPPASASAGQTSVRVDLAATRNWRDGQVWTAAVPLKAAPTRKHGRHR